MSPFRLTSLSLCHGHKIQPLTLIELEIEFCLKTNLDFFLAQIPQRPTGGASLGISRMESLICRNSSQLEFNRTIVNSGTASGKVGARSAAKFGGKIEFHRESRSVAHPPPSQSVILSSEENLIRADMSPHLFLGGAALVKAVVTGGWVVGTDISHGGWQSTGKLTHRRTVTDPLHARSSQRTRTWAEALLLKYASFWPRANICLESQEGIKAISFLVTFFCEQPFNLHLMHICLNMFFSSSNKINVIAEMVHHNQKHPLSK